MSTNPPKIEAQALPQTPAAEWANSTAHALGSDPALPKQPPITTTSNQPPVHIPVNQAPALTTAESASGPDFPGAFPRSSAHETAPDPLPTTDQVKGTANQARSVAADALNTAQAYLPSQHDVENALQTAKGYLPQAVQSYLPGTSPAAPGAGNPNVKTATPHELSQPETVTAASFPKVDLDEKIPGATGVGAPTGSATTPGVGSGVTGTGVLGGVGGVGGIPGATGGVGELPGAKNESGVAVLPDERKTAGNDITSSVGTSHPPALDSAAHPSKGEQVKEKALSATPGMHPDTSNTTGVSSTSATNQPSTKEKVLSAVPGTAAHEQHKTSPPTAPTHEYSHQADLGHSPTNATGPYTGAPLSSYEPSASKTSSEAAQKSDSTAPTAPYTGAPLDSHESSVPKSTTIAPSATSPTHDSNHTRGTSLDKSHTKSSSTSSGYTEGGTPKKSGFMNKIKGEVKIIQGKMGKNEAKIEEGKKLMGKE